MYVGITRAQAAARALARVVLPGQHEARSSRRSSGRRRSRPGSSTCPATSTARRRTRTRSAVELPPEPERALRARLRRIRREIARIEAELERLRAVEARRDRARARWRPPSTLSVTAFLTFVRDAEEFFWRYVRRVPSPPSPAAQLGIELHRRIEQHARGAVAARRRRRRRPRSRTTSTSASAAATARP